MGKNREWHEHRKSNERRRKQSGTKTSLPIYRQLINRKNSVFRKRRIRISFNFDIYFLVFRCYIVLFPPSLAFRAHKSLGQAIRVPSFMRGEEKYAQLTHSAEKHYTDELPVVKVVRYVIIEREKMAKTTSEMKKQHTPRDRVSTRHKHTHMLDSDWFGVFVGSIYCCAIFDGAKICSLWIRLAYSFEITICIFCKRLVAHTHTHTRARCRVK